MDGPHGSRRDEPLIIDAEPGSTRIQPIGRGIGLRRTRRWIPLALAVVLAFTLGAVSYRLLAGGFTPFSVDPSADGLPAAGGPCSTPVGMTSLIDQDFEDSQKPWKRTDDKVTIYFAVGDMAPEWRADHEYGAAQWNKSPCLDVRVVDECPSGANCVTVAVTSDGGGADGNFSAKEKGGFTVGGKIELKESLSAGQRKNVVVHEMGHAVGLRHRKTERVLMNGDTYDDVFNPDATDYKNLLFSYDRLQRSA